MKPVMAIWKSKLLLLFIFVLWWETALTLFYEGTRNTYARYEEWNTTVNGTLKLEFKTQQSDALLLYTDDGGTGNNFLELKLEQARLRLRFRIRNKARSLYLGDNLNLNEWHEITLIKGLQECVVILNGVQVSGAVPDTQDTLSADLFIGGVPASMPVTSLSNEEVKFATRFEGHVRNLKYLISEKPKRWYRPELLVPSGILEDPSDLCGSDDWCLNHGLCVSYDTMAKCDCSGTGYSGLTCEIPLIPQTQSEEASDENDGDTRSSSHMATVVYSECSRPKENEIVIEPCLTVKTASRATFDGQSYISYSLARRQIASDRDEVLFDFRTQQPSGMILSVGEQFDYIYVAMNGGNLEIAVNLGSGEYREIIRPRRTGESFIDNEWHKVRITRDLTQVIVRVDESPAAQGETEGDFMRLTASREFLVGGAADTTQVPGHRTVAQNFRGNLRDVIYNGELFMLDLLYMTCNEDPFIQVVGNDIPCTVEDVDAIDPITFLNEESFLLLPKWNAKMYSEEDVAPGQGQTQGTLSFNLRTNERNGVIMYNRGADHITDFFALELNDGYLYMILDLGSGPIRHKAASVPLADGLWHHVSLDRYHNRGTLQVDAQEPSKFEVPGTSRHLNLEDHLVLGGINVENDANFLPIDLYSGVLRRGYVGCIKNLDLQGVTMDLPAYAVQQDSGNNIGVFCREEEAQCSSSPCLHDGECTEGWNRFICDCRLTGYTGKICEEEAARLSFNGNQYMRITVPSNSQSKVEDIFVRFRTRFPDGLIAATSSDSVIDMLMVQLVGGVIQVQTNYGLGLTKITAGRSLDDNKWHAVHVQRQDERLMVTVDDNDRAEAFNVTPKMPVSEHFQSGILDYHYIEVGGMATRDSFTVPPPNYVGHMEQFVYNSHPYFDMAMAQQLDNVVLNATFGEMMSQRPITNAFTFRTKAVYAQLETPETYPSLTLFFHFKTTEPNGLMLYSQGDGPDFGQDFISVSLVGGQIQYAFNMGAGPTKLHINSPHRLNDNKWHEVSVSQDSRDRHVLQVDNETRSARPSTRSRNLDLTENLYVGGMEPDNYVILPAAVEAREGFQGCLASLEVNGMKQDLYDTALSIEENKRDLTRGCEEHGDLCLADVCANGGVCSPGWNSYSCDCRMTSFSGVNCSEVSTSFNYGTGGGLISLQIPEDQWMRTDRDSFSLGVASRTTNAVLARIDSATSDDYIEMELVNGYVWVTYNFGTADHDISDNTNRINDGVYHVIHFSRTGANASLQVDQYKMIEKAPKGKQSTYFDDQAMINIGGRGSGSGKRKRRRRAPDTPFEGLMSGLSYNDLRVLDVAASNDSRVTMTGNVIQVDPTNMIYGTPIPIVTGATRKTPVIPPNNNNKPASTANTDLTSPTKIAMSIAPTADGEYPTTDEFIFVSTSDCNTNGDENCTPQSRGPDEIIVPDEPASSVAPPEPKYVPMTTPMSSTSAQPLPPSSTEPGSGCNDDDEDCMMTASGDPDSTSTASGSTREFPFTTVRSSKTNIGEAGATPNPDSVTNGGGFDFLGEAGLVVGVVSAAAVVFILVILAIYKLKNRNEGSYQINESRNYNDYEATRTSLLPQTANTNGTVPSKPKPALPPEYATKEWYV